MTKLEEIMRVVAEVEEPTEKELCVEVLVSEAPTQAARATVEVLASSYLQAVRSTGKTVTRMAKVEHNMLKKIKTGGR